MNFEDSGLGDISTVNLQKDQEQNPGSLTTIIFCAAIANLCLSFSSRSKSLELIKQGFDKTSRFITLSTLSTLTFTKFLQQQMTQFNHEVMNCILCLKLILFSPLFFTSLLCYITTQCPAFERGRTELIIQLHQNILSLGIKFAE